MKPIRNEPVMLMRMVPHGNAGPVTRAMAIATQARAMLPNAPPNPISA